MCTFCLPKESYQISETQVYIHPKEDEATGLRNHRPGFALTSGLFPDTPKQFRVIQPLVTGENTQEVSTTTL